MNTRVLSDDSQQKPIFILTIDTEEEWDWSSHFPTPPFSTNNIREIPQFQQFCKDLGVKPTYFTNYAVIDDEDNVAVLKEYQDNNLCDIGAHLHPWCTPPITEEICEKNSHAINLPLTLFKQKMQHLTERHISEFGKHPYSFRAGRWGMNGAQLEVLSSLGYCIDSSVRPYYSDSRFSYNKAKSQPYWPSFSNLLEEDAGQNEIVEIPASSGYTRHSFDLMDKLHRNLSVTPFSQLRLIGILWRLKILRKVTITPEGHDEADICACIDRCIERGDRVINMFFHSSDLLPGCTPYVKNSTDKVRFLQRLEYCVNHMRVRHNATFLTMRQTFELLSGSKLGKME